MPGWKGCCNMRVYSLIADYVDKWISSKEFKIRMPELRLPRRYCSMCKGDIRADCAEIPEEPSKEIVKLLKPYQDSIERVELLDKLMIAVDENEPPDVVEALNKKFEQYDTINPKEFKFVAERIKNLMNLPPYRLIIPRKPIGTPKARVYRELKVDMIVGVSYNPCAVLTEKAVEMLANSGLTGMEFHPIQVVRPPGYKLYTMIVYGDGGEPKIVSGKAEYWQCPECGVWSIRDHTGPIQVVLDEDKWDGSDFFHFMGGGGVCITERAKEWFEGSGLRLLLSLESMDDDVFFPLKKPEFKSSGPSYIEWSMKHLLPPKDK